MSLTRVHSRPLPLRPRSFRSIRRRPLSTPFASSTRSRSRAAKRWYFLFYSSPSIRRSRLPIWLVCSHLLVQAYQIKIFDAKQAGVSGELIRTYKELKALGEAVRVLRPPRNCLHLFDLPTTRHKGKMKKKKAIDIRSLIVV
jgi:hypothetical protein